MTAIEIDNLTKIYRLYKSNKERVKEFISLNGRKYHHDFFALKDISFSIKKGETVGIIGQNGSGKSTLLKIICGVTKPTSGIVTVNGRISSLLELGAGFHPDFTGRENVYMNGALMGFSKDEIDIRLPEIEAFADIGEFIDQPVKSYSSGMYVRLAFSAAIHIDPEILIVDEALSVGDMFFQYKCVSKIKEMIDRGVTLLFVSHSLSMVKSLCNKCVLLSHSELVDFDSTDRVVEKYIDIKIRGEQKFVGVQTEDDYTDQYSEASPIPHDKLIFINNTEFKKRSVFQRIQNGKAAFKNIQLLNKEGVEIISIDYEQEVTLRMAVEIYEDIPVLCYGYQIKDRNGVEINCSDSILEDRNLLQVEKGERYIIDWKFSVSLTHGNYSIVAVLSIPINMEMGQVEFCDRIPCAMQFEVQPRPGWMLYGLSHWHNKLSVEKYIS